jgi:tripartite-type tricarboxylate transporter receptor subunit TctC
MKARFFAAVLLGASFGAAAAQDFPTRPITIVVPFPPGGPVDTLGRILADRMRSSLGHALLIENIGGAGGTIGVGRVVRAAPDGYTLSLGNWGTHVVSGAVYPLRFDLLHDLVPVALLASNPQIISANKAVPAS